jgi:hypothetical protein
MEESIQELLIDLKIMSMVEPNGKLYMQGGNLALEPVSIWQPVRRYLSNSNRTIVSHKIKQRIVELENLLKDNQIKQDWILQELFVMIEPLKSGLANLQNTYSSDSQIQAMFSLFLARLDNIEKVYFHKKETFLGNN